MNDNGNVSPDHRTTAQRAMLAADAVDKDRLNYLEAAARFGVGHSTVERALAIKRRSSDVAYLVRRGDLSIVAAARRVGFRDTPKGQVTRGDKWSEVVEPARVYAEYWADRPYSHINPKEARRRLATLHQLQQGLAAIERELVVRGNDATLTAPRR